MHELAVAEEVVAIVVARTGGAPVARIVIEIGRLCAVVPDAMRFCFELATEGTAAEGATLEIVEVPGEARCRACGGHVALDRPFGWCGCGSSDLEWLNGEQLSVKAVELA
jgi:hydrogenase nickel incorporation protein HypA/HybF